MLELDELSAAASEAALWFAELEAALSEADALSPLNDLLNSPFADDDSEESAALPDVNEPLTSDPSCVSEEADWLVALEVVALPPSSAETVWFCSVVLVVQSTQFSCEVVVSVSASAGPMRETLPEVSVALSFCVEFSVAANSPFFDVSLEEAALDSVPKLPDLSAVFESEELLEALWSASEADWSEALLKSSPGRPPLLSVMSSDLVFE